MPNYTTNLATNPGLQLGLTGYSAVNNATIAQSVTGSSGTLFGNPAVIVTTPGVISGEGLLTPTATVLNTVTHSVSVYVQGITTGNVTVSVIQNPGGTILGTTPVNLTSSYQRVVINNLSPTAGNTLSLMVTTNTVEAVQFWATNIQIEPESPAQNYCDGGQQGCFWTSTVGGTSYQPFQNTVGLTGASNINSSNVVNVLIIGKVFNITVTGALNKNTPNIANTLFSAGPVGAMTDFSVASLTDPDPAQTYAGWNNAGLSVPTSGYARSWSTFFPPQDYFASGNLQLFKRGAFMAAGWQFSNVPNNAHVIVSDVQVEVLPMTTSFGAPAPTNYVLPRAVQTTVKPTRLNFCTNPSVEVSTAGWSAVAGGVLSQDPSTTVGNIIVIDDQPQSAGIASLLVTVTNSGDGAQISVPNLIAGDTYIVSAYVQADVNVTDILMTCANGSTSAAHGNAGTGYGTGTYGGGFYGGNPPSGSPLTTGQWYRIFTTFQPTDSVATLIFSANVTAATGFWIDAVLIEAGSVLSYYFDGNFGKNYFWETGGTAGLTRSYFYDQFGVKSQAVTNVLQHHTPLGISFVTPVFNQPYTQ
jgi:hypothetical protein